MPEDEAIKYATIHLDGVAHEWWYDGLVTMGHDQITSYANFIERFDVKDPKLYLKKLTQLKQLGSLDTYIVDF
jgi:hypothetical protein